MMSLVVQIQQIQNHNCVTKIESGLAGISKHQASFNTRRKFLSFAFLKTLKKSKSVKQKNCFEYLSGKKNTQKVIRVEKKMGSVGFRLLFIVLFIHFSNYQIQSGNSVTLQQELIFCPENLLIKFQLFCQFVKLHSFSVSYIPNTCRWLMSLHICFTAGSELLEHFQLKFFFNRACKCDP